MGCTSLGWGLLSIRILMGSRCHGRVVEDVRFVQTLDKNKKDMRYARRFTGGYILGRIFLQGTLEFDGYHLMHLAVFS